MGNTAFLQAEMRDEVYTKMDADNSSYDTRRILAKLAAIRR